MQTRQSGKFLHLKWKVFIFAIFLCILITSTPLFAAETIEPESWDEITQPYTLSDGDTLDLSALPAEAGGKIVTIPADADVTVIGSSDVAYIGLKIELLQNASLTIQNLRIDNDVQSDDWHAVDVKKTGTTLILEGSNYLHVHRNAASVHAPEDTGVTITSFTSGSLTAFSGDPEGSIFGGAAIGGAVNEHAGGIIISGNAVVTASAAMDGAGIGSGALASPGPHAGTITISDNATVTATSYTGAGIGGASNTMGSRGSTVIITGGAVYARSVIAYDIGPGLASTNQFPATTTITGGSVNARKDKVYGTPKNAAGATLTPTAIDFAGGLAGQTLVFMVEPTDGDPYEYTFLVPSDDVAYLWLPAGVVPPAGFGTATLSVDVVSLARNTPAIQLTATAGDSTLLVRWERIDETEAVLEHGEILPGEVTTVEGIQPGTHLFRVKALWEAYGTSADAYSNTVAITVSDVTADDIGVTAYNLPNPIRAGDSAEITYTFTSDTYPVTLVGSADTTDLPASNFGFKISGDTEAVLSTDSAGAQGSYSVSVDVIADGLWVGPIGMTFKIERAANSDDVKLESSGVPVSKIFTGLSVDAVYTAIKTAGDLSELEASIGNVTASDNWDESAFEYNLVSPDTLTVTGTAQEPGVYALSVPLKLGEYNIRTESVTYTVYADADDITVSSDSDAEDILRGDNVDIEFSFALEEFPDAEVEIVDVKGAEGWEESGLIIVPGEDGKTFKIINEANIPGEYEISVLIDINGAVTEITIPVVIAAQAKDITVIQKSGKIDIDNITEGDEVDVTYGFVSSIPNATIIVLDAKSAGDRNLKKLNDAAIPDVITDWEESGLDFTVNQDGTIRVVGTAKTPGDYAIDVNLTLNDVPVEDVKINISILAKETPPPPGCKSSSSGCSAVNAGLYLMALLPVIYIKKRNGQR
ncbi:hypothetical protein LJC40_03065 [Synergistaceae bacterium OttesenSCG-928-D05]|nr:hypothetical protein [Synergistaceae bacterium OttesenSCG-928-D05]